MTTKTNSELAADKSIEDDRVLAPRLKSFVQMVKRSLSNQTNNPIIPSDMIKNAEKLEKTLSRGSSHALGNKNSCQSDTLLLDPILHHRVMLATGIAKSFASGSDLSCKRRKILQSNIEYLEKRL